MPAFSSALDPKARPHSLGISFVAECENNTAEIGICVTWARYSKIGDPWKRKPKYFIKAIRINDDVPLIIYVNGAGLEKSKDEAEVSVRIITKKLRDNAYHVNIYLVNEIRAEDKNVNSEEHIFQPQIRIVCNKNTKITPKPDGNNTEDQEMNFLYREHPALAKGFLCSAVWKAIDPERKIDSKSPHSASQTKFEPPFYWTDGAILSSDMKNLFSAPDIRTEFVPVYPVESPKLQWDKSQGQEPELSAKTISELWTPDEIKRAFEPLASAYEIWLHKNQTHLENSHKDEHRIWQKNIRAGVEVLKRVRNGINLLVTDEDARLAFCIANEAMALQYKWSGKTEQLNWHPYQLAFILMTLESVANSKSPDRGTCDLLWVPTGAGKTEAYLAISAFIIAYRRRKAIGRKIGNKTGAGVAVISRYTLRLLTIQQFRRTLNMITAMEYLRVFGLSEGKPVGWRPESCSMTDDFLWGTSRFSIGLWVGGQVTPNSLDTPWLLQEGRSLPIWGAFDILEGKDNKMGEGEPAQILNCPCCKTLLAIPGKSEGNGGLPPGEHKIFLVLKCRAEKKDIKKMLDRFFGQFSKDFLVLESNLIQHSIPWYFTISTKLKSSIILSEQTIDDVWNKIIKDAKKEGLDVDIVSVRASRPGYFLRKFSGPRGGVNQKNFEIYCPNPDCELNRSWWVEGVPFAYPSSSQKLPAIRRYINAPDDMSFDEVPEYFRINDKMMLISNHIPITALTVDEQIYRYPPSFVVATVDKFARLPFEPRCSALFGNITFYDDRYGFYRQWNLKQSDNDTGHAKGKAQRYKNVLPFDPPNLIIQDELHLIEGPLGSMVGFYETAIEQLCGNGMERVKYIASTATVKQATEQVSSLFSRQLLAFPPAGVTTDDRFFIRFDESHPLDENNPGRLYLGVCAPGRGSLTPIVRIWARLLKTAQDMSHSGDADPFWTVTGYFNAIRELAGATALYRQDIPERLRHIGGTRSVPDENKAELSSRTDSTELPLIIESLNNSFPHAKDALFTTSMFGTGIDIPRLGLMVVHGQPKTSSSYIQATGRVGRRKGALIVVFYRATRPRDLNHYEFFCGYHGQLHRFVEPVTVSPFAPGVLAKATGPVLVGILRNGRYTTGWNKENSALLIKDCRNTSPELRDMPILFENRARDQIGSRKPANGYVFVHVDSELDRWEQVARLNPSLLYLEYTDTTQPIVLGDLQHQHAGIPVVYKNSPQSLREIEETTGFMDYGG